MVTSCSLNTTNVWKAIARPFASAIIFVATWDFVVWHTRESQMTCGFAFNVVTSSLPNPLVDTIFSTIYLYVIRVMIYNGK